MNRRLANWKINNPGKIPAPLKSLIFAGLWSTNAIRCTPNFLIIGFQKCSTTSLYSYLASHPQILVSHKKEINFFGGNVHKGLRWYRSHFPTRSGWLFSEKPTRVPIAVGEASTIYAYAPGAPREAFAFDPTLKIVAVVRDPVARTISHYFHCKKIGEETRPMDEALADACDNLERHVSEWRSAAADVSLASAYREPRSSYILRSLYSMQIENWQRYFDPSQVKLISAEDLSGRPDEALSDVCSFLGVGDVSLTAEKIFNRGKYTSEKSSLDGRIRELLKDETEWCRENGVL